LMPINSDSGALRWHSNIIVDHGSARRGAM
jgi:hypothetical protein